MKKKPECQVRTKANLLEAFWKLYEHNSLYKISIRVLAETAGYNGSTFYEYFLDIDDLLEYAEKILLETLMDYFEETIENNTSRDTITKAAKFYDHYSYYLSILFGPKGDPAFAGKYKRALRPLIIRELNLDPDSPHVEFLGEYILGAVVSSIVYWHRHQTIPAEDLAAMLHTRLTNGVFSLSHH